MNNKMGLLDCTLRDGGYYNNWDFSEELVESYLSAVADSNIEYVELGLRNFPKEGFLGAYAYTTESHLNSLNLPEGPIYGVMVDAKTIITSELSIKDAIDTLFIPASQSKISLVRVAAHFHEVESSGAIVEYLKELGYTVGFNLMQAGGKSSSLISEKARQAASWSGLDVLYFADSLGNMDSVEVERIVQALSSEWSGELGIHTHNNMGKGLDNTLTAINAGITWVDSTITGMGRGAGNTQTEILLAVLDVNGSHYRPKPIYKLVIQHFEEMQKQYGWGSSLLYYLGAQNEVHPTYIQNLLSNSHYGTEEVVGAIDYLNKLEGTTSYHGDILDTALTFSDSQNEVSGSEDIVSLFQGKSVLVLTNGPSTQKYRKAIEIYIKEVNPVVISINIVEGVNQELIDYYIISHNSKFLSDAEKYKELNSPIILPKHRFLDEELLALDGLTLIDYGLEIKQKTFEIKNDFVTIPFDVTFGYLLGVLNAGNANSITLVGLDGYEQWDIRQQEMVDIFTLYGNVKNARRVQSLTPTSYPISKGSIYALN